MRCPSKKQLRRLAEGCFDEKAAALLAGHTRECRACGSTQKRLAAVVQHLATLRDGDPPALDWDAIYHRIETGLAVMTPCPEETDLLALIEGKLEPTAQETLGAHVSACPTCAQKRQRIDSIRGHIAAVKGAPPPELSWRKILTQMNWRLRPQPSRSQSILVLSAAMSGLALILSGYLVARYTLEGEAEPVVAASEEPKKEKPNKVEEGIPVFVEGRVELWRRGKAEPLELSSRILPGDRIVARDGRAAIRSDDDTMFVVHPQTTLDVTGLSRTWHELVLHHGEVANLVGARAAGQRYALVVHGREVRVRGTRFVVQREQLATRILLTEGAVDVSDLGIAGPPLEMVAPSELRLRDGVLISDLRALARRGTPGRTPAPLLPSLPAGSTDLVFSPRRVATALALDDPRPGAAPFGMPADIDRASFDDYEKMLSSGIAPGSLRQKRTETLPEDRIRQVSSMIRDRAPELRACYERQLKRDPALHSSVELRVAVDRDGVVSRLSVQTSVDDPVASNCLTRVVKRWQFGPGSTADMVIPLSFRPGPTP